jgi:hypothetical protein
MFWKPKFPFPRTLANWPVEFVESGHSIWPAGTISDIANKTHDNDEWFHGMALSAPHRQHRQSQKQPNCYG